MTRRIALTRAVSPNLVECALSFLEREPIDVSLAERQHRAYEAILRDLGLDVVSLPAQTDSPDAVFVEDTTVVVDELAVMTRPALETRRREVASMADVLAGYRELRHLDGTATLEGGDVLRIDRRFYVGVGYRTNREGAAQLAAYLEPRGYEVIPVQFSGCLHLKTACTYLGRNTIIGNPTWVNMAQFPDTLVVDVAPNEPEAGNALAVGDTVILPKSFPDTRLRVEARDFKVQAVDVSELQKAEAGVTCCSVIFSAL
jgi:dimethylargininase